MEKLFKCDNYVEFLKIVVAEKKSLGHTQSELARMIGCQAAYFSQVLNGKVDLVEENLIRLAEHLPLSEIETEYLLNLLRQAKAGTQELKSHLERQNNRLRSLADELEPRLSSESSSLKEEMITYYSSSWVPSVIHVATSCENFQNVKSISERFGFEKEFTQEHLQKLAKFELVKFEDDKWKYNGSSLHFPKNSDFEKQMQISRKLLSTKNVYFRRDSDLHYSVIFSSDLKTIQGLRSRFLDFIEDAHRTIEPSPSEEVYSISIDLFKV